MPAAQEEWEKRHYTKHRAPWQKPPKFEQVLKGKIEYLGMIRGQESPAYLKFLDQLGDLDPTLTHGRGTPLRLLLRAYDDLSTNSIDPQARGLRLEDILNSLFDLSGVLVSTSFKRNAGGEQIDGAFALDGWYYLVECRWRAKMTDKSELDGLLGKVGRSGAQTMGVFISVNGWSHHVVSLMKQDPEKRVLLMNGEDIRAMLAGECPLSSLVRHKVEALNVHSEPFVGSEGIVSAPL